jgi:hypothetical protein
MLGQAIWVRHGKEPKVVECAAEVEHPVAGPLSLLRWSDGAGKVEKLVPRGQVLDLPARLTGIGQSAVSPMCGAA